MSNPSFSNIDRWLFELMEGNLTPEQEAQLEAFLLMHPELDVDRDSWEMAKVDSNTIVDFPDKQKLSKRRPIGLYMSLSFASMAGLIAIGLYSMLGDFTQFSIQANLLSKNGLNDSTLKQTEFNKLQESNDLASKNDESTMNSEEGTIAQAQAMHSEMPLTYSGFSTTETGVLDVPNLGLAFQSKGLDEVDEMTSIFESSSTHESPLNDSPKRTALKTQKAVPLYIAKKETGISRNTYNYINQKRFGASEYHLSLSARVGIIGRRVQRMMDNPVALKNLNDPYYHVPGMQSNDINFAAVGSLLATRVQTVSRAQWLGKSNQQLMNQISVDGYSYAMRGGVGFQLNHNYYGNGSIENYHASFTYSPKFSISRQIVLEPAVRFKMGSKMLGNAIQTGSMVEFDRMNAQQFYSAGQQPIGRMLWYRDLGLGLMVNTKWFYASVQQDNILRHYDNIYSQDFSDPRRAPKHLVASIGADFQSAKEKIMISPYLVYQKEDQLSEAWAGFNLKFYWLTVGGALSSNLEPAASVGLKFKHFMLQYNADLTNSQIYNSKNLSHQLTLRFLSKPSRVGQRLLNQ
jgi:type IX secretion system PorP/SprF family membrane protein